MDYYYFLRKRKKEPIKCCGQELSWKEWYGFFCAVCNKRFATTTNV